MEEDNFGEQESRARRICGCCDWRGCCVFPHGKITALALAAAVVCWFLTGMGIGGCDMAKVDGNTFIDDFYQGKHHGKLIVPKHYGLGPYMRQNIDMDRFQHYNGTTFGARCVSWSPKERHNLLDPAWKASMGFAAMATMCISFGSYVLCAMSCCANPCGLYCWSIEWTKAAICLMFGMASMFQLLTFCAFGSDIIEKYDATISTGGYVIVASMFLSFLTAILIRPQKNEQESQTLKDLAMDVSTPEPDYNTEIPVVTNEIPVENMIDNEAPIVENQNLIVENTNNNNNNNNNPFMDDDDDNVKTLT